VSLTSSFGISILHCRTAKQNGVGFGQTPLKQFIFIEDFLMTLMERSRAGFTGPANLLFNPVS
jgi:hypothetical protein